MKTFWGTLVIAGFLIVPSGMSLSLVECIATCVAGVSLMIFAGCKFCDTMEKN